MIEVALEISPDIRVGIFIDGQRSRGVLDKQMQDSCPDRAYFGQVFQHFSGDEVKSAWSRPECKFLLHPYHMISIR